MPERRSNEATRPVTVPRQRTPDAVVVAVLESDEPLEAVVRLAARAAHERDLPLHIALTAPPDTSIAHSMAVMDDAVSVARAGSPGIQVSVSGPFGPDDASILESLREGHVRLVVCSPRTRAVVAARPGLAWLARRPVTVV